MTTQRNPVVTVLMGVYKDAEFVRDAVESILSQTFTDFEYLIINDGSPDGSREIVASYRDPRVCLIDNPTNMGHPRSLNRGLSMARGELIARFDANDIALKDRLEKQVRFMREHPDVALVGGQMIAIDVDGSRTRRAEFSKPVTDIGMKWYFMFDSPFIHPATMYRKSIVWDRHGGYNPAFSGEEDAELWMRVAVEHRVANLPDVLVELRHDPRSTTYDIQNPYRAGYLERISEYCRTNMRRYLQMDDIPEDWPRIVAETPRSAVGPDKSFRFLEIIDEVERRFIAQYPEARRNREVRAFKAQLQTHALFQLALISRLAGAKVMTRIVRGDPSIALKVLPKFAAYFVFKRRANRGWEWLRSRASRRRQHRSGVIR